MENKRGSGIFLGVVGVATLIVAIIGATFAYFSASTTADNTVNLEAYEFNATLSLHQVEPETAGKKLIPMNPLGTVPTELSATNTTNLAYAMNEAGCIDSQGFQVCALYKATIVNSGKAELKLNRTLTTTENTPGSKSGATGFANLMYLDLTGEEGSLTKAADATEKQISKDLNGITNLGTITVAAETTEELYFVVYLNEVAKNTDNPDSNNPEMGSKFTGTLTFADDGLEHQLTATFKVAAGD